HVLNRLHERRFVSDLTPATPALSSRSYATYVGRLSRSALRAPGVAFDATCTSRIEARYDPLELLASPWVELRHGYGTKWQTCSEVRGCLTRIRRQGRSRFAQAVIQYFQEVPHGLQGISVKVGSHLFPQQAFAAPLSPGRLEQRTTQLLHLIHQKRQHHQRGKHHGEVLIAVAEIVLEMIALIFQRIERLIFDAPASPCPLHEPIHRAFVDT